MRYAILSDVHANLQALEAVLYDIVKQSIDEIICLGDLVGYGPNPLQVMELSRKWFTTFVLGNHDAGLCGRFPTDNFNDEAVFVLDWTKREVRSSDISFFKTMPWQASGENFICAHAEVAQPDRFGYIVKQSEAKNNFASCEETLIFVGHSHIPGMHVIGKSGRPHWLNPADFGGDFSIQSGKRYIVNVGSVGDPRDQIVKASYCIYDTDLQSVFYHRVPFDVDKYRDNLRKNKLPESNYFFELLDS